MDRSIKSHRSGGLLLALVLGGALTAVSARPENNDQAEVLLQSAIHKETVDGELEDAIDLYEKIVASHRDDRAVAARALLRMGGCYEKLGKVEARKAYERLLRDYADQSEAAERARTRLAVLLEPGAGESGMGMMTRRVWAEPKTDFFGRVSPDGRYLSFVDWETGDLAVRDLEKGTNRRLTAKGSWEESSEEAELSIWSPDSRQIAYEWWGEHGDLRVIGLGEPEPRVLHIGKERGEEIQPCDWSPDGRHILALAGVYRGLTPQKIVLVSVVDGTLRNLKALPRRVGVGRARFTADGRHIVYDSPQADDSSAHDIFLLPVDGGPESTLVEHPADDLLLGCGPEGEWVLFASDRSGTLDVWAIRLGDGAPQGSPVLVKAAVGRVQPMGFTRDGSFFYGVPGALNDVLVGKLDPAPGVPAISPTKVVKHYEGYNHEPRYSPDGRHLAYLSTRGNQVFPLGAGGGDTLCIRSLHSGETREFQRELVRLGVRGIARPRWSPDGTSMLFFGRDREGLYSIYHIDLKSGVVSNVLRETEDVLVGSAGGWRDGKTFLYRRIDKKSRRGEICSRDLESGEETSIHTIPPPGHVGLAVSPDGRLAAIVQKTRSEERVLVVLSTDGDSPRELGRFERHAWPGFLEWSADGEHVLFTRRIGIATDEKNKFEVWRMPLEGGPPQRTGLEMPGVIAHMSAHPDGQHLAFEFRAAGALAEIWALENFLPPHTASN
jgi:Tol biopolymer transport system component